jgi:acyl carrier protein
MRLSAMRKGFVDGIPPLWRSLVHPLRRLEQAKRGGWAEDLRALSPLEREAMVLKMVRAEVARVLSMSDPEAVAKDRALKELGLDSLMAVELRNALGKRVGKTLPATLAFDHPNTSAITTYLLEMVLGFGEATTKGKSRLSKAQDKERLARLSEDEIVAHFQNEFHDLLKDLQS